MVLEVVPIALLFMQPIQKYQLSLGLCLQESDQTQPLVGWGTVYKGCGVKLCKLPTKLWQWAHALFSSLRPVHVLEPLITEVDVMLRGGPYP